MVQREEGFQSILMQKHLLQDEIMFRNLFLVISQFNYILSLIRSDLVGKEW